MAAKPKIPVPANADETYARTVALLAEFKVLAPFIVKTMTPFDGLKRQRATDSAWLNEFYTEATHIVERMGQSIKEHGLSTPPEPQPEPTPEPQPEPVAAEPEKPARRKRPTAAEKAAAKAAKEKEAVPA